MISTRAVSRVFLMSVQQYDNCLIRAVRMYRKLSVGGITIHSFATHTKKGRAMFRAEGGGVIFRIRWQCVTYILRYSIRRIG